VGPPLSPTQTNHNYGIESGTQKGKEKTEASLPYPAERLILLATFFKTDTSLTRRHAQTVPLTIHGC